MMKKIARGRHLVIVATMLAAAVMAGCASPTLRQSPQDEPSVSTFSQANVYIERRIGDVRAKRDELITAGQLSRAGTFLGALGVGAAALAHLHKDAAIGFAALGALSYQGLSLAYPPVWIPVCNEAIDSMRCLAKFSSRLDNSFRTLEAAMPGARSIAARMDELEIDAAAAQHALPAQARSDVDAMSSLYRKAEALVLEKSGMANAIYEDTRDVVHKLEDLLYRNQPPLGAFQLAAASIVSQATAAALPKPTAPAPGSTADAGARAAPGERGTTRSVGDIDREAGRIAASARDAAVVLKKHIDAIGEDAARTASQDVCKHRLAGAVVPLRFEKDPPEAGYTLGDKKEASVAVSGGTGTHFGYWIDSSPASDLISFASHLRPGLTVFQFKQLKKETAAKTFTFVIVDSGNPPQKKEVKLVVPANQ